MRYRLLGKSGLRVSELALGTMTFGEAWGWGASREESRRIFDAFVDAGGNFVDTACNYTDGESESLLGEFVQEQRERLVLATKYTLTARRDDPNAGGNHRKNLVQTVEASLRRLNTDYVDLLWLHMWDGLTPVEEVVRALDDLVSAGKVLYVGLSDTPAWVVSRAVTMAELSGRARPVALQHPYSLADRDAENELLPMAQSLELAVTTWGVLEGGALTGKYLADADGPRRYDGAGERVNAISREVVAVADELGATAGQVATAWVLEQPWPIIPIVGARSEAQIRDNLGALELELTDEQLERLSEASGFRLGFPRSFLESDHVRGLIFGDTFEVIDDHRHPSRRRRRQPSAV
jgi:aryl-alcohol dehydrogenase-like predicted oxidoreductase